MKRPRHGFTLVELLTVVAIVALLVALLLPSLHRAKRQVQMTVCLSNLRQVGIAAMGYSSDHKQFLLSSAFYFRDPLENSTYVWPVSSGWNYGKWLDVLSINYLNRSIAVLECPAQEFETINTGLVAGAVPKPTRLGYMVNRHARKWKDPAGNNVTSLPNTDPNYIVSTYAAKLNDFQKQSEKIWYADAGTRWHASTPTIEYPVYGTHSRFTTGANDINNTGLSRRHFEGANYVAFDLHARHDQWDNLGVYGQPGVGGSSAQDNFNQKTRWSPIGSVRENEP